MCGIAGIVAFKQNKQSIVSAVERMTNAQVHRGPDDSGVKILSDTNPVTVFGHRRLSVIDLSSAGRQPMYDPETDCWITYNGELYNYRTLRSELQQKGRTFRTDTDTEVILNAYAEWNKSCVDRFRGIFAFAIWDNIRKRLFLTRDQMGVKPLYYYIYNGSIIFASEVRSMLASGFIDRKINYKGLQSYLTYGSVQDPYTLVKGIHSLGPGTYLSCQNNEYKYRTYWQIPLPDGQQTHGKKDIYPETLCHLTDAISSQLVADVPLGVFLSGGIDSTVIAAIVREVSSSEVKTLSIVFDEDTYDERKYSRLAAEYLGTDHTELLFQSSDIKNNLRVALASFDQPSIDGLNTYFISKVAKEAGLTVALSGVGGDEVFGGYDGFRKNIALQRIGLAVASFPFVFRKSIGAALHNFGWDDGYRRYSDLFDLSCHPYFISRRLFSERQLEKILTPEFFIESHNWEPERFNKLESNASNFDRINQLSYFELQMYMLSTLLRDTDQMSMAHALEVRVPFIDHKLVEYMFTIPGRLKIDKEWSKPLLTKSLNGRIPAEVIFRKKKGFELPFDVWFRDVLYKDMQDCFKSNGEPGIFGPNSLSLLWEKFLKKQISWSRVWSIFMLKTWLSRHRITV